ncbi:glycoside hydrolase family 2 TIM barrel-domain containing protein [Chitinophagaceae bacterium 26-R-25]|nr:glycoside hydrolase family 2 TIM barrel-domain containing protein [Chitinophagaceae bacterium 26-R-25]
MKKQAVAFSLMLLAMAQTNAQNAGWKPVTGKITTEWASKVDPNNTLPEYPTPQMVRGNWASLNGLWQYAITPKSQETLPATLDGNILVPFAVESSLSGVAKTVGKDSVLWYKRTIDVPSSFKNKNVLLHFGAVDWQADIFLNGQKISTHQGGFEPFTVDLTSALKKGSKQELAIRVWDPTDEGPQPRGKQVKKPEGIWYTPVTGIWQTVWIEGVAKTYIASSRQTPNVDAKTVSALANVANAQPGDEVRVAAFDGNNKVAEQTIAPGSEAALAITNPHLWSTTDPHLYDLTYTVLRKGKVIDEVKSYFAMRKISLAADKNGIQRMMLNDKFVFQYGPLDQGWWPDGLYTAPTDEALKYDIVKTKGMGFNMIRKHIKVEPARWYYYCDQMGMLVWQDMPSGDLGNHWENRPGVLGRATDKDRSAESEQYYRTEWNQIIDALYNFPSIIVWTPFNEAWGQFKTADITSWTMQKDPTRLVNSASGGNFYPVGHICDLHNYPEPAMPRPDIFGSKQAVVLGEFGGLGLPVEGHTWQDKNNWGYRSFKNADEMFKMYASYTEKLQGLIKQGLSAAVYTQTTDVEVETNGFMTYDRKVMKMPEAKLKEVNEKLYNPALAE